MKQIIFLISIVATTFGQVPSRKSCPDVPVQQHFQPADYLGLWYEYEAYPALFELTGKCISAEYTLRDDGKIGVFNRMINRLTCKEKSIVGYATPNENEPAKLTVVFPRSPFNKNNDDNSNYWVLGTDYKNYSVVWSCRDLVGGGSVRFSWILTRDRIPSEEVVHTAHDVLDKNGIPTKPFWKTIQTGCDSEVVNNVL